MQKEQEFLRVRTVEGVYCESAGEYILPDYNTDVKKILFTKATPTKSGTFHDSDTLEFVGTVCYDIVYLDGDNNITHTNFNTDYALTLKCNGEDYIDSMIKTKLNGFYLRLIGPRKFSSKASLESCVYISERDRILPNIDSERDDKLECTYENVKVRGMRHLKGEEKTVKDVLTTIDSAIADEVEILTTNCESRVNSLNVNDGKIELKGENLVCVLIKNGEESPFYVEKIIPFEDVLEDAEFENDMNISGFIAVSSVKSQVIATEDGVTVECELSAQSEVLKFIESELRLISDCYFTDVGCENEYGDFSYTQLLEEKNIVEHFNGEVSRESVQGDNIRNIVFSNSEPRTESVTKTDTGVKICGTVRFNSIACDIGSDNIPTYCNLKFDVPFEKNVNLNSQITDNCRFEVWIDTMNSSIQVDDKNFYPTADMRILLCASTSESTKYVKQTETTDEVFEKDPSLIKVYFPKKNDTLFDIGKMFHISPMQVAQDNSLSQEVFSGSPDKSDLSSVKRLIIK